MNFQQRFAQIDGALAEGVLDEHEWHEQVRELVEAAYLAAENPQAQSGLGGDAAHWERRRRIIAEALDRDGALLDVGCANGLLMETLVTWARALARARLPAWADRIDVGNVIAWEPPRRFDYVRIELEYVPRPRQPELVARLLERVVAPGGRLVVCAYRSRGTRDAAPIGEHLRSWGFSVSGEATATDPTDGGAATRVVWLDAPG